jgi:hypothetical protein
VYVRGFAPLHSSQATTFHDAFYGFADSSVNQCEVAPAPDGTPRFALDIFEGQLVRFMKEQGYVDAYNDGLNNHDATRSLWICRFYDRDFLEGHVHPIEDHANELFQLVTQTIPNALAAQDVDVKNQDGTYARLQSDLARALDGQAGVPHLDPEPVARSGTKSQ